jgi:hypothetical protein
MLYLLGILQFRRLSGLILNSLMKNLRKLTQMSMSFRQKSKTNRYHKKMTACMCRQIALLFQTDNLLFRRTQVQTSSLIQMNKMNQNRMVLNRQGLGLHK